MGSAATNDDDDDDGMEEDDDDDYVNHSYLNSIIPNDVDI
jgi:hypothetical protein